MDTRSATRPVVVGVDGSAVSAAVLRWAVDEALERRSPLCVVHALDQPYSAAFVRANPVFVGEERRAAEDVLDTAVEHARSMAPDLDVRSVLEVGSPAVVLLRQAAAADLVVLGSRGRGGFSCLLLGSTSLHVAMHAPVVVVVLRPPPESPAPRHERRPVSRTDSGRDRRLAVLGVRAALRLLAGAPSWSRRDGPARLVLAGHLRGRPVVPEVGAGREGRAGAAVGEPGSVA